MNKTIFFALIGILGTILVILWNYGFIGHSFYYYSSLEDIIELVEHKEFSAKQISELIIAIARLPFFGAMGAIIIWWTPFIVHRKIFDARQNNQIKLKWKLLEQMKSSNILDTDSKSSVIKLTEAFQNNVINEKELFSKLEPYFVQAKSNLKKNKSQQKCDEIKEKIDKINQAYKDGIIDSLERDVKLKSLKKD